MDLTETYQKVDQALIEAWVSDREPETLHLEFKTLGPAGLGDRDARKNFAKALSGFANSAGGLIVWGIEARPVDGVDAACEAHPIGNVDALVSALNTREGESVSPLVSGVRHRAIKTSDTAGYAVTIVPESDAGPHMAKSGEDRYYKRSGSSFYRMEHFDIADMFGRRRRPSLSLRAEIYKEGMHYGRAEPPATDIKIVLSLENVGRGSAIAPYLEVIPPFTRASDGIDGGGKTGLPFLGKSTGHGRRYGGSYTEVIHPEENRPIDSFRLRLRDGRSVSDQLVRYKVAADGYAMEEKSLTIDARRILDCVSSQ